MFPVTQQYPITPHSDRPQQTVLFSSSHYKTLQKLEKEEKMAAARRLEEDLQKRRPAVLNTVYFTHHDKNYTGWVILEMVQEKQRSNPFKRKGFTKAELLPKILKNRHEYWFHSAIQELCSVELLNRKFTDYSWDSDHYKLSKAGRDYLKHGTPPTTESKKQSTTAAPAPSPTPKIDSLPGTFARVREMWQALVNPSRSQS